MYILISFYGFTTPWIQIHCKSKCKKIIRQVPCYLGRLNVFHYLNAKANNLPSCDTKLTWPCNCLLWSLRTWFRMEQWKLPLGMCVEIFKNKTNCFASDISCECSPKISGFSTPHILHYSENGSFSLTMGLVFWSVHDFFIWLFGMWLKGLLD